MATMVSRRQQLRSAKSACAVPPGHPMARLGFQGSRHMMPERLPSAGKEKAVSLRIIDLNKDTVQYIRDISTTLKILDCSDLCLESLSDDVMEKLYYLEKFNLNNNELSDDSFPESFVNLESLIELSIHENSLTRIPRVFQRLANLSRLKFGENSLETVKGVEKLKRLKVLVLDRNQIESFSKEFFTNLKRLEILHCASNKIIGIPGEVRNFRYLRELDLSDNNLTYLPPEAFLLPRLEVLNASSNQINRLPTINVKGRLKRKLATIDLSDNALTRFPGHLLFMTDRLDLGRNKIRVIPLSLVDKLDQVPELDLVMEENPMTNPPIEVCEGGLGAIVSHYMEIKAEIKIFQGLKVLMLGASGQGKTSLVQSIIDQQPRLTDNERTVGLDVFEYSIDQEEGDPLGKSLNLSIWDFAGNPRYYSPHYLFLHQPALVLIVFNMADYDDSKFYPLIGYWLDWIIARTNQLVILTVGTHSDLIAEHKVQPLCQRVYESIVQFTEDHVTAIDQEMEKITSRPHISPALSEQLKQYINLKKLQTIVYQTVVPVSALQMKGMEDLFQAIQTMAANKDVFTNVMRVIPSLWVEVENFLDDRGYAMQIPVLTWEEYVEEVTAKFGMKHLVEEITRYLHDTGKVIWYHDHACLSQFVFLRPSWLTDVLKAIFRHDLESMDYAVEEAFKQYGIHVSKFDRMRRDIIEDGIVDRDFLKACWTQVFNTEFNKPVVEVLTMLIEQFQIGYSITKNSPSRKASALSRASASLSTNERVDSAGTVRSGSREPLESPSPSRADSVTGGTGKSKTAADSTASTPQGPAKIAKVLIPWLRETKKPRAFDDEYRACCANHCVTAVFRFPKFFPPGLFAHMTTRVQSPEFNLKTLYHWKSGLYARHTVESARFYLQRIDHDDASTCVRMEVRYEEDAVRQEIEYLWKVLLPFIKDVETLVSSKFTGLRLERYMECPFCHNISFLGEWLTPKELQTASHRQCESCRRKVSTCYLIQPKERRLVEDFLMQKLRHREMEKQAALAAEKKEKAIAEEKVKEVAQVTEGHAPATQDR